MLKTEYSPTLKKPVPLALRKTRETSIPLPGTAVRTLPDPEDWRAVAIRADR